MRQLTRPSTFRGFPTAAAANDLIDAVVAALNNEYPSLDGIGEPDAFANEVRRVIGLQSYETVCTIDTETGEPKRGGEMALFDSCGSFVDTI